MVAFLDRLTFWVVFFLGEGVKHPLFCVNILSLSEAKLCLLTGSDWSHHASLSAQGSSISKAIPTVSIVYVLGISTLCHIPLIISPNLKIRFSYFWGRSRAILPGVLIFLIPLFSEPPKLPKGSLFQYFLSIYRETRFKCIFLSLCWCNFQWKPQISIMSLPTWALEVHPIYTPNGECR